MILNRRTLAITFNNYKNKKITLKSNLESVCLLVGCIKLDRRWNKRDKHQPPVTSWTVRLFCVSPCFRCRPVSCYFMIYCLMVWICSEPVSRGRRATFNILFILFCSRFFVSCLWLWTACPLTLNNSPTDAVIPPTVSVRDAASRSRVAVPWKWTFSFRGTSSSRLWSLWWFCTF